MGFLDKFLNVMRLNPDEEDDFFNEDYDFEEDDFVEEKPTKSSFKAKKEKCNCSYFSRSKHCRGRI